MLRKNHSNELLWNHKQAKEFETASSLLSETSQMLKPFNPELSLGLLVDTAKTTGIEYILFHFDPLSPPGKPPMKSTNPAFGQLNFALQGAWSVEAKSAWADLSPRESEVIGYWNASQRLHYHIQGPPRI